MAADTRKNTGQLNEWVGGAEIVGRPRNQRPYRDFGRYNLQQDTVSVISAEDSFFTASSRERMKKYTNAFKEAQDECNALKGGSCGLVAGACFARDKRTINVHTANMGDSTAFLVVYDENGRINREKSRMLNALHEYGNSAEIKRVENAGGVFELERLSGSLACSRSIESASSVRDHRLKGLGTEPEYLEHRVRLDEGEKAMLIVSCDGMLEGPFKFNPEMYGISYDTSTKEGRNKYRDIAVDWMQSALTRDEILEGDPRLISSKLMQKSAETSTDNISIMVQELSPERPPILIAVFDGHGMGGEKVSRKAAEVISAHCGRREEIHDLMVVDENPRSIRAIDNFVRSQSPEARAKKSAEADAESKEDPAKNLTKPMVDEEMQMLNQQISDISNNWDIFRKEGEKEGFISSLCKASAFDAGRGSSPQQSIRREAFVKASQVFLAAAALTVGITIAASMFVAWPLVAAPVAVLLISSFVGLCAGLIADMKVSREHFSLFKTPKSIDVPTGPENAFSDRKPSTGKI